MTTLRYYQDGNNECIVICTDKDDVNELMEGKTLQEEVELDGDFTSWPTNRALVQEH